MNIRGGGGGLIKRFEGCLKDLMKMKAFMLEKAF